MTEYRPIQGRSLLDQVTIINEREGGLVEAYVPIGLVNQEEVAVDEQHADELADSIAEQSAKHDTIGQLSPVLLAEVEGRDGFMIIDGFHRTRALNNLGKEEIYATIKKGCTVEEVIDLRIIAAKSHKKVSFSRIIEWVEEAWQETAWSDKINVQAAFQITFLGHKGTRSGVTPDEGEAIREWVRSKSAQWDISPSRIDSYLRTAKLADPELVKSARERRGGGKLEAVTPKHLAEIARYLPENYPVQNMVAAAAIRNSLTIPQTKALSMAAGKAGDDTEKVQSYIDTRVWERMTSVYKDLTKSRYEKIDPSSPEQFNRLLADKFFDDQINIAQLLIENAILTGSYTPQDEEVGTRINALLMTSDKFDDHDLGGEDGEVVVWSREKIDQISREVTKLRPILIGIASRKFGLSQEDSEDVVSNAMINFLTRVNDGRLPKKYENPAQLRALLANFVKYSSIDHIREVKGRKGQKIAPVSIDEEIGEGITRADTLQAVETNFDESFDNENTEFIKMALPLINERGRRVLVLKAYFELNAREIASIIGTTEGTIHTVLKEAADTIRKLSDEAQLSVVEEQAA
jgi:RNA polymerase sigma factor (sigma-70 family)